MTTTTRKVPQTGWPPLAVRQALRQGKEPLAVQLALRAGQRDEIQLTNLIFFHRHPERNGALLRQGEPGYAGLAKEWLQIRDTLVRPALARPAGAPGPVARPNCISLEGFDFNKVELQPNHVSDLEAIAQRISDSQGSAAPIRTVRLIGHTDPVGSPADNHNLGLRRADKVKEALQAALERKQPGSSSRVEIKVKSEGEARPVPNDDARSRRVEVCLPAGENRWRELMGGQLVRPGNLVVPLVDGPATFRAMAKAICSATGRGHYIYLLGWWLDDDLPLLAAPTQALPGPRQPREGLPSTQTARLCMPKVEDSTMLKLLTRAAENRVQVRAMLWNVTYPDNPTKNTDEVKGINGLPGGAAILDSNQLKPTVGSQHQKVLIVKGEDGLIAFCGGVDINHDRVQVMRTGTPGTPFHDVHCSIRGPAAYDMLDVFIQRWFANPKHHNLDTDPGPLLGLRDLLDLRKKPPPLQGSQFVRIGRTFNEPVSLPDGQRFIPDRSVQDIFLRAVAGAQRFIYIEEQFLTNMCAAAALNAVLPNIQHLTILIPATEITNTSLGLQGWYRRLRFLSRVRQGPHCGKVQVFFLVDPSSGRSDGFHTYVHSKLMIVDDELALIGSPNINRRSWETDAEVVAAIFDHPVGAMLGVRPFAQSLRMRLWAEHLNMTPDSEYLWDGVASAKYWAHPPPGARVRPYNPTAGSDPLMEDQSWDQLFDPPTPSPDAACCQRFGESCGPQPQSSTATATSARAAAQRPVRRQRGAGSLPVARRGH